MCGSVRMSVECRIKKLACLVRCVFYVLRWRRNCVRQTTYTVKESRAALAQDAKFAFHANNQESEKIPEQKQKWDDTEAYRLG